MDAPNTAGMGAGDSPRPQSRWKSSRLRAMSLRSTLFAKKMRQPTVRDIELGGVASKGQPQASDDLLRPGSQSHGEKTEPDASKRPLQKYQNWIGTHYERVRKFVLDIPDISPTKDGRHIILEPSRKEPLIDERTGKAYMSNLIRSSKYTPWNFLPRQMFVTLSIRLNSC